jgi:hypothetical protein
MMMGLLVVSAIFFAGLLSAITVVLEKEEYIANVQVVAEVIASSLASFHHKRQSATDANGRIIQRRYILWDHERAQSCINQDYLGQIPSFSFDDFKSMFRLSRSSYEAIKNYLCEVNYFFRDGSVITGRKRVRMDAKILISLKYLAYSCSVNAFHDYFQLGKSTAMLCVKKFTQSMANSEFQKAYFFLPHLMQEESNQ